MKAYEFKSLSLDIKDVDKKQGIVTGYFAAFDTPDSDRDIIRKGAFVRTIRENGPASAKPRIKHLLNHMPSQPLGNLTELKEDTYGLYYESKIGTHNLGQDFIKMVESELIKEHSIGYRTIKRNQVGSWDKNDAAVWELVELMLYEGSSLTAWGANPNTPLTGMKGMKADAIQERIDRLEKFCRNTDATDDTVQLLLLEVKQLHQHIIDISASSTLAAGKAPEPPKGEGQIKDADLNTDEILSFIHLKKSLLIH